MRVSKSYKLRNALAKRIIAYAQEVCESGHPRRWAKAIFFQLSHCWGANHFIMLVK